MINTKLQIRCLALLLMTLAVGCATAYHGYSGCYVDCQYCAPPPLPYTHYDGCVCHSCAASPYLNKWSPSVNQVNGASQSAESKDDQASAP
jgi:hypothetical protein